MATSITYDRLLSVNILHDFFLNKGRLNIPDLGPHSLEIEKFDDLIGQNQRVRMEEVNYNIQQVLDIVPTKETITILKKQNWVFSKNKLRFFYWGKNQLSLPIYTANKD